MLTKRSVLLAALEGVGSYNTDAVPAVSGDEILVENASWSWAGAQMAEQPVIKNTLGPKRQIFGGALAQITFTTKLRGSGTIDTPPEIGRLLVACGMAETVTAGTSVAYAPASANHDSATLYLYEDGKLRKFTGCRGTWQLTGGAGQPLSIQWTFTGHHVESTDTSMVTPSFDSTVPPVFKNASFQIDGYEASISQLGLNIGNTVNTPVNPNGADGYGEVVIADRDPTASIDPLEVLNSVRDWIDNWQSGTPMALQTGTVGSTEGNRIAISAPVTVFRNVDPSSRDGLVSWDGGLGLEEDSGDDQVELLFT